MTVKLPENNLYWITNREFRVSEIASIISVYAGYGDYSGTTTDKSVRWYANDMRKKGIEVPSRQKAHPADMDAEQSAEAMKTVRVVEPAADD